jgi:glycosyltransferase involved in cell wall biosynthesis
METSPRVLLLITHLEPGGAQETVVLLAERLPGLGFDVTVASAPGGVYEQRIRDAGARIVSLTDLVRPISPVRDARALLAVDRLVRRGRFDVVHTHSSKAGIIGRLAARRAHVPAIVHTSHGLPVNPDMPPIERGILLAAERLAARACHRVVAVSEATARELHDLRLARNGQTAVIPSGVHIPNGSLPPRAQARAALGVEGDSGPVVGWVGRHFPQKRPELVVRASRRLLDRRPDAQVVLVGDGPLLERTRSQADGEPRIKVLGHRGDIDNVYAAMDVFMLASAWEGLPRTVLEAQAAGVPVVSTRVSGIPEVVHHGRTGLLVEPGDWRGLADAAIRILDDEGLRRSMADAARRTVTEDYSAGRTAEATAELYRSVLTKASALR